MQREGIAVTASYSQGTTTLPADSLDARTVYKRTRTSRVRNEYSEVPRTTIRAFDLVLFHGSSSFAVSQFIATVLALDT